MGPCPRAGVASMKKGHWGEGTLKEVRGSLKTGEQPVQRHRGVERQLGIWESRGVRGGHKGRSGWRLASGPAPESTGRSGLDVVEDPCPPTPWITLAGCKRGLGR